MADDPKPEKQDPLPDLTGDKPLTPEQLENARCHIDMGVHYRKMGQGYEPLSEAAFGAAKPYADANNVVRALYIPARTMEVPATIPVAYRSRAISLAKAAKLLGRPNADSGVPWLKACIADGTIRCEQLSRQSYVFDRRQFPPEAQNSLSVTPEDCR